MDPLQNEESQAVQPRRRKRRKPRFAIPLPLFLQNLGQDVRWYYDIRLWSPLIVILFLLALIPGRAKKAEPVEAKPQIQIVETQAEPETVPETEPTPLNAEAVALAKLADSVGAGRSDNVKIIIMWVAINRSEAGGANGYGLSVEEEILRPNQWQGYDDSIRYSEGTYQLALDVLKTRDTGSLRPLDSGMYWFVLNDNGSITVRNQFTATKNQPWFEKTVK